MKDLKKIKGAKTISKSAQQAIKGGTRQCNADGTCYGYYVCVNGECVLGP